jgi:hypothetical protein
VAIRTETIRALGQWPSSGEHSLDEWVEGSGTGEIPVALVAREIDTGSTQVSGGRPFEGHFEDGSDLAVAILNALEREMELVVSEGRMGREESPGVGTRRVGWRGRGDGPDGDATPSELRVMGWRTQGSASARPRRATLSDPILSGWSAAENMRRPWQRSKTEREERRCCAVTGGLPVTGEHGLGGAKKRLVSSRWDSIEGDAATHR